MTSLRELNRTRKSGVALLQRAVDPQFLHSFVGGRKVGEDNHEPSVETAVAYTVVDTPDTATMTEVKKTGVDEEKTKSKSFGEKFADKAKDIAGKGIKKADEGLEKGRGALQGLAEKTAMGGDPAFSSQVNTGASSAGEIGKTTQIGDVSNDTHFNAGQQSSASAQGSVYLSPIGAGASGSANAGVAGAASVISETKLGDDTTFRGAAALSGGANGHAEGTAYAGALGAGASGSTEVGVDAQGVVSASGETNILPGSDVKAKASVAGIGNIDVKATTSGSVEINLLGAKAEGGATVSAHADGKVSAKAEIGILESQAAANLNADAAANAKGVAQLGPLGGKIDGKVDAKASVDGRVGAQSTLKIGDVTGLGINLDAGVAANADGKAVADASARAGAYLGLTGVGATADAKASAKVEASGSAGVKLATVDAVQSIKVTAYAKAEAHASALLSWKESKVGLGAMAQAGAGVEANTSFTGEDGNSAVGKVTLLSPGAAGLQVQCGAKFEDGVAKITIGGGFGAAAFGLKGAVDININLKAQKDAVESAIKDLQQIKPQDILSPEKTQAKIAQSVDVAASKLIEGGKAQGGIGGKLTEVSGHILGNANQVVNDVVKPVAKVAEKAVSAVVNFFKGW